MGPVLFYCAGCTEACLHAAGILKEEGIAFAETPCPQVTDLMLDVPGFNGKGNLRDGTDAAALFAEFPQALRVWGGKLSGLPSRFTPADLLEDPGYLAENAAITADCAMRLSALLLKTTWQDSRVLVIGWGRIGKCLCRMLKALGSQVTVCARKPSDRALLNALGYDTVSPESLTGKGFQILYNTAPEPVMTEDALGDCPIPVDLASLPGLEGRKVLHARGLPGVYAPVSSGKLIADTILRQLRREKP